MSAVSSSPPDTGVVASVSDSDSASLSDSDEFEPAPDDEVPLDLPCSVGASRSSFLVYVGCNFSCHMYREQRGTLVSLIARVALERLAAAGFKCVTTGPSWKDIRSDSEIDGLLTEAEKSNPLLPLTWFKVGKINQCHGSLAIDQWEDLGIRVSKVPLLPSTLMKCISSLVLAVLYTAERVVRQDHRKRLLGIDILAALRTASPEARALLERLGMWNAIDAFDKDSIDPENPSKFISDGIWLSWWCIGTQRIKIFPLLQKAAWYHKPQFVDAVLAHLLKTVRSGERRDAETPTTAMVDDLTSHCPAKRKFDEKQVELDLSSTSSCSTASFTDPLATTSSTSFTSKSESSRSMYLDQGDAFFCRRYHIYPVAYLGRSVYGALAEPDMWAPRGYNALGNDDGYDSGPELEEQDTPLDMIAFDLEDAHGRRWPLEAEWRLEACSDAPGGTHYGAVFHRPSGIQLGSISCTGQDEGGFALDAPVASRLFKRFAVHGNGFAKTLPRCQIHAKQAKGEPAADCAHWSAIEEEVSAMCAAAMTLTFNIAPERLLTLWNIHHPASVKERFAKEVIRAAIGFSEVDSSAVCPLPVSDLLDICASYLGFDLPYLPLRLGLANEYSEAEGAQVHHLNPTVSDGDSESMFEALKGLNRHMREYYEEDRRDEEDYDD